MSCPFKEIHNTVMIRQEIAADDLEPNVQYRDIDCELKSTYEVCKLKSPFISINLDLSIPEDVLCKGKKKCPYFTKDGRVKGW